MCVVSKRVAVLLIGLVATWSCAIAPASAAEGDTPYIKAITASKDPAEKGTAMTIDDDLGSGWSVEGEGQWICFELSEPVEVGEIALAWAEGDKRVYRFEVFVSDDGKTWRRVLQASSCGKTNNLETYRFEPSRARFVKVVGHGNSKNRWNNIMEARIGSLAVETSPGAEMFRFELPKGLPADAAPGIYAVTARESPRLSLPQNVVDGDPKTVWAAQHYTRHPSPGIPPWLTFHLTRPATIDRVRVATGCDHAVELRVRVSLDGRRWRSVASGKTAERVGAFAEIAFEPTQARFVRLVVLGSADRHWHQIAEVRIGDVPYRPSKAMQWWSRRWLSGPPSEAYLASFEPALRQSNLEMARSCLATLVDRGTDRYGKIRSPIWVLNLDIETLDCFPRYNDTLTEIAAKSLSYSSTAPYGVGYRAIRGSQREPGCSNLFVDQPTIRAALLLDRLAGKASFTPAVNEYIRWNLDNLTDPKTGLLRWGVHVSYDVYDESLRGGSGYHHEVQCILPIWPAFARVDAAWTKRYLEKFWYWHTNPKTGKVDRHNTRGGGLDFAMAAGEIILACACRHTMEPDGPWLERALQIAHAHWDTRDPTTNLFVNTPHGGTGKRFDNTYSDTSVTGMWASRVMMAGRLTDCDELTAMARGILLAWAKHGWDHEADKPWASLRPDGTPNTKPRDYSGTRYDKFDPSSHWDFWKDYLYGFEYPFATLMTYGLAARWLGDEPIKQHAVRLAECYRRLLPANGKVGTFAANYGRLISFYLLLADVTGDASYRRTAEQIADEAVRHLWTGKVFRGFVGRTHYTAAEGIGYLVQALIELDADPAKLKKLREQSPFWWNL